MSRLALAIALSACGRIDFDATDENPSTPELRSLCRFTRVTIVENGIAADDNVAAAMQSALRGGCGNAPVVRTVSQDDNGVLDPVTDRLLIPEDELVVIGGGEGPNRAIRYMRDSGSTPIVWDGTSTATFRERATNRVIASGPVTDTHDFLLLMVIVEPTTGTRVLSGQGFQREGTLATALYFEQIAPAIESNTLVWTLIDWTDTNGDGASDGDRYAEIESG